MSLNYLPGERQPNARSALLGREKGDEQVVYVRYARPGVLDMQLEPVTFRPPADLDGSIIGLGCLNGVFHKVEQGLLKLIRIRLYR